MSSCSFTWKLCVLDLELLRVIKENPQTNDHLNRGRCQRAQIAQPASILLKIVSGRSLQWFWLKINPDLSVVSTVPLFNYLD